MRNHRIYIRSRIGDLIISMDYGANLCIRASMTAQVECLLRTKSQRASEMLGPEIIIIARDIIAGVAHLGSVFTKRIVALGCLMAQGPNLADLKSTL